MQVAKLDFSTVLPRFISLYIFSFLNPKDLCAAAQVSWPWKFLTEQDCLWMPKCIRFGWFLLYTPADNEYGAWKHHYIACVSNLDWLTPREAAAIYGTLNEPKTKYEELQEKQREKCLRKLIWEKSALRKKELFKVRPPWVSRTCCSRLLKSKCQPRLSQALKDLRDRGGLHEALEKQLVLASLEALPKRSNIVVASIKTGIISVVYEHRGLTLDSLLYLIEKALDGQKVQSMGIFSDGDSREINLLQGYKIGIKNLLRPEVRDFWEKLGSYVAPEEEGGHVDLFVPLGASEAGIEVLSQLSQLTGTFFTAPTGIATGSYQHNFLEDTLKSVRKQLSPLFKEFITKVVPDLEWIIQGQFTFDNMNMANILDNQEISQALADGLMKLSKDNSDKPLEFLSDFLLKKCGKGSQDLEENVILTKCDPKAAFSLLPKMWHDCHFYPYNSQCHHGLLEARFILKEENVFLSQKPNDFIKIQSRSPAPSICVGERQADATAAEQGTGRVGETLGQLRIAQAQGGLLPPRQELAACGLGPGALTQRLQAAVENSYRY
ncbi:Epithelial cell-transforming sequence 2 oncogene-like [Vulpes lagopus]